MNTKTAEEIVYPLTIIPCRYGGCYSGAKFHAFNMEHKSIPEAATGDDVSCAEFWGGLEPSGRHKDYRVNDWGENLFIGSGETPQAAYDNLRKKMGLMMEEYRSQSDKGIEQEKDTIIQQLMEEVERLREEKKEWNEKQRLNYEQKIIEQEETIIEQEETISALRSQLSQQPTDVEGKPFEEIIQKIHLWQNETFPNATPISKLKHLEQEVIELILELTETDSPEKVEMEYADCFFLLFGSAYAYGLDLNSITRALQKKLAINKSRVWGEPDKDGVVNHVKFSPPPLKAAESQQPTNEAG